MWAVCTKNTSGQYITPTVGCTAARVTANPHRIAASGRCPRFGDSRDEIQIWLMPPSTGMSAPVVKLLRSEARNSAAFATSSAVP